MKLEQVLVGLIAVAVALMLAQAALSQETDTVGAHPDNACQEPYHASGAGWDVCWQQEDVRVQGLEINRAFFEGESVIWKMGVPFSLTKYETMDGPGPFKDTLGDASGLSGYGRGSLTIDESDCPRFQPQGELVNGGKVCIEHQGEPSPQLSLWAKYDIFNYRFLQGWHFDDRGVVEPFVFLGGQLLDGQEIGEEGRDHHHHVYWRVDFDIGSEPRDTFQAFKRIPGEKTGENPLSQPYLETSHGECRGGNDLACAFWTDIDQETQLPYNQETHDKWRVVSPKDTNEQNRPKSFEFVVKSDGSADHFSTFDAMAVEHKGDSQEIGHNVPSTVLADTRVKLYMTPPEEITDPVVWLVNHVYHETRDEERGTMVYHDAGFKIQPRNFLDENPSEATYP